jgi:cyclohexanecarboxylate-CoA ligase
VNPGNEVRIVDEEGRELPPGVDGEIVSRGPEQFFGYLASPLNADAYFRAAGCAPGTSATSTAMAT